MSGLVVISAADLVDRSVPQTRNKRKPKDARDPSSQQVVVSNVQRVGLYNNRQQILVVGDGNLSFSLSLASFMGGKNVVATCYDSESTFREKYPSDAGNIAALRRLQAEVYFNVDAMKLHEESRFQSREAFQRILFNFPHSGASGSNAESVRTNQELLQGYFVSASLIINPGGQVHMTLRDTTFYQSWEITEQASNAELEMIKKEPFDASLFVGYEVRRTASSDLMRQAPSTEDAFTYCFSLSKEHPRYATDTQVVSSKNNKKRKRPAKSKKKKSASIAGAESYSCSHCGVNCATQAKWNGHINSAKHSKNIKKAKKSENTVKSPKKKKKT